MLGQGQHATKTPAPLLTAHFAQFFAQQHTIGRHVGVFSREPRRPHARRPAQRIDLQTGIIGQHPPGVMGRSGQSLQFGILFERVSGLLHLRQIRTRGEILDLPSGAENLPHLARFVRVARGEKHALL